jgi:hypothetical protein
MLIMLPFNSYSNSRYSPSHPDRYFGFELELASVGERTVYYGNINNRRNYFGVTEEDFNLLFQAALILHPYLSELYISDKEAYKSENGGLYLPAAVALVNKVFDFKSDGSIDAEDDDEDMASLHSPSPQPGARRSQTRYLPDSVILHDDHLLMSSSNSSSYLGPASSHVDHRYKSYVEFSQMTEEYSSSISGVEIVTRRMDYPPSKKEQWTKDVFAAITLLQNMTTLRPHVSCGLHISLTCYQPHSMREGLSKGFGGAQFIPKVYEKFGKTNELMESLFGRKPTNYCSLSESRGAFNYSSDNNRFEFRSPSSNTSGLTLFQTLLLAQDIVDFTESLPSDRSHDAVDTIAIKTAARIEKFLCLDSPTLESYDADTLTSYLNKLTTNTCKPTLAEAKAIVRKLCVKHGISYQEVLKQAAYELVTA